MRNLLETIFGFASRRATGVEIRGDAARVVTANGVKPPVVQEIVLHPSAEKAGGGLRAKGRRKSPDPAYVALPQHMVVVRFVDLPTQDPAETRAMARWEAIRQVPLPENEALVGCAVLGPGAKGYSRVALFISRRGEMEAVERKLASLALGIAGFFPKGYLLARSLGEIQNTGRVVGVLREPEESTLVALLDGRPIAVRGFARRDADPDTYAAWMADEIRSTLDGLERTGGASTEFSVVLHSEGPNPARFGKALERALEHSVEADARWLGAPGGMALLAMRAGLAGKDGLVAPESSGGTTPVARWLPTVLLGLAVFLSGLSLWGGGLFRLHKAEKELTVRWRAMEKEARALEDIARRYRQAHRRSAPTDDWPGVVALLNRALPARVKLTELVFERGRQVDFRGRAPAMANAVEAVGALEKSGYFKTVELKSSVLRSDNSVEFQIVCGWEARP